MILHEFIIIIANASNLNPDDSNTYLYTAKTEDYFRAWKEATEYAIQQLQIHDKWYYIQTIINK